MKVEFYRHHIDETDIENVAQVLRTVWLSTGPATARFEKAFAGHTGIRHAVGVSSGTAALHLALQALGLGEGDEVITTPMTFIASANAVLYTGARPVFVDIEPDTGLIDARRVEAAVTPRTRAVLPVHLYGALADMKALRDIADRHGLKIVEDSAHCVEGERDGVRPGWLGDVACFSFYATKNLTSGEGGAVAANDPQLAERVRRLRTHGMSKGAADRYHKKYSHWDMVELGWKYNLDDIHASLLIAQLGRLESLWQRREEIAGLYDAGLAGLKGVDTPAVRGRSARHLYTIWVDPDQRDRVMERLMEQEIGVAVNYRSVHTMDFYRRTFGFQEADFPNAYTMGRRTISLPFYPRLTNDEIEYVIQGVRRAVS